MMKRQSGGEQTPASGSAPASTNPQTKEEIQALLDNLDVQLASGKISEAAYNTLYNKWQKRLESMS
jgi:hypothetical protein